MSMSANFHDAKQARHVRLHTSSGDDSLQFNGDENHLTIFVPPHVAAHTAAAFNRAMQAVRDGDGWTYTTKSGVWHISDEGKPFGFRAQHDDITGDNDPAWMFTEASTLIGCMDAIDIIESENTCTECHALVGDDATDMQDGKRWLCSDCLTAEQEHERGLAEMADDDRAHAAMERVAGL